MKRSISLFSVLAFVLAFSGSVLAQDDITASAEILSDIDYTVNTDINFSNLEASFTSATIDPSATSGDASVSSNATAARITINGANDATVLVTDPGTQTLTHTNGTSGDELELATDVTGQSGDNTNARGGSTLTNGNELDLDGSGIGTLWIGGQLTPNDDGDGSIDTGTYNTTFTLTLNYL